MFIFYIIFMYFVILVVYEITQTKKLGMMADYELMLYCPLE